MEYGDGGGRGLYQLGMNGRLGVESMSYTKEGSRVAQRRHRETVCPHGIKLGAHERGLVAIFLASLFIDSPHNSYL